MLEKFNVNNVHLAYETNMVLYQHGRTTGLILDSGDGLTHTMPSFEGMTMPYGSQTIHCGGRDLTDWLSKELHKQRMHACSWADGLTFDTVRDIKEKCCFVSN